MWWVTLPYFSVFGALFVIPDIVDYAATKFFLGNRYNRCFKDLEYTLYAMRDARLSGKMDPYVQIGLEALGDVGVEDTNEKKKM